MVEVHIQLGVPLLDFRDFVLVLNKLGPDALNYLILLQPF
jgi:hypothetical protein